VGAGRVTPPPLTTTLFSSCSVDISFKDDVSVILLGVNPSISAYSHRQKFPISQERKSSIVETAFSTNYNTKCPSYDRDPSTGSKIVSVKRYTIKE
jgi:hypothetical protein